MKPVQSKMGRRRFLATATATSASALALGKLSGIIPPILQPDTAVASDGKKKAAGSRYENLLSPLCIGNVILKNRMYSTDSFPVGIETSLSEKGINHYIRRARNGASIVTFSGTGKHRIDATDGAAQTLLLQLTEGVHFHDAKIIASFIDCEPSGYNISNLGPDTSGGPPRAEKYRPIMGNSGAVKEIPVDMIKQMIDDFVNKALLFQTLGFDGIHLYMSYRSSILACSLSPAVNVRTDQYGGSIENRVRLSLELAKAIKSACGQDFLVEAQVSGEEEAGGYTVADLGRYAKLWEGAIDILQIRGWDGLSSHPTGYNSEKNSPYTIDFAEAVKKSGAKIITAPNGGYHDLDMCESYIADGKADMIAMARSFICDPGYGEKAYEGRGEDVVPCILCNKCHGPSHSGPNPTMCSVNPKLGLEDKLDKMIPVPAEKKKVAVIGGGPAGMKAALVAAERGHQVTLYEKNDHLGGQLKHVDYAAFQWPIKEYKEYLIRQVEKSGVAVHLKTRATPEVLRKKGYDALLVALGAEYLRPDIPGAEGSNVYTPLFAFGNKSLGKKVVVIGGDLIGTQTGIYLAENGHDVTILTADSQLAPDAPAVHYMTNLQMRYEALKNFSFITGVNATGISEGEVAYADARGGKKTVPADSVVVSVGRNPRQAEAMAFAGAADRIFVIGDCNVPGSVRTCTRSAFANASHI